LGQKGNGSPVKGLYHFIQFLMKEAKFTEQHINLMTKTTPAKLLEL
jgi:hypothetical protein